jgi:hypothetical protein
MDQEPRTTEGHRSQVTSSDGVLRSAGLVTKSSGVALHTVNLLRGIYRHNRNGLPDKARDTDERHNKHLRDHSRMLGAHKESKNTPNGSGPTPSHPFFYKLPIPLPRSSSASKWQDSALPTSSFPKPILSLSRLPDMLTAYYNY